jgi:hypothetical protein
MNISSNRIASNAKKCESLDQNLNSQDYSINAKDKFLPLNYNKQHFNSLENILLSKKNDIISYYYATYKNLLNSEEFLKIFSIKKASRNFVRKTMLNSFFQKDQNDNDNYYNDKYLNNDLNNNYKHNNKSIYNNNTIIFNDSNQRNNIFLSGTNNIIYIGNSVSKNIQNNVNNNNKVETKEENSSSFCNNLSPSFVHNNITKNIINNNIDYPPFIPSNHQKKPKEEYTRKKSEDSLSKDKSDSTSAFSEKREEENLNSEKKEEKKDSEEYLLEMFGRIGWICKLCNNFNYETRIKCNRCGILKTPKKLVEIKQRNAEERDKEGDWSCIYCKNLNYSFRSICNRCKIPKTPIIYNSNLLVNKLNLSMIPSPCFIYINNGKK